MNPNEPTRLSRGHRIAGYIGIPALVLFLALGLNDFRNNYNDSMREQKETSESNIDTTVEESMSPVVRDINDWLRVIGRQEPKYNGLMELDAPEGIRSYLEERGYFGEECRAE